MTPREYYSNYLADNSLSDLNKKTLKSILHDGSETIFEFGCGTGKNLEYLKHKGKICVGLDISLPNIIYAKVRHELPCLIIGTEDHLQYLGRFDSVFTVSVLDHIENIDGIIKNFKRMSKKSIYLAETNDVPNEFYYPHDYESYGFEKLDYSWTGEDGATYFIWRCAGFQE